MFVKRYLEGNLRLVVTKTTDDVLVAGDRSEIYCFSVKMKERFIVGKAIMEARMKFNGCVLDVGISGEVVMSIHEYLERLAPIEISRNPRK